MGLQMLLSPINKKLMSVLYDIDIPVHGTIHDAKAANQISNDSQKCSLM